MLPVSSIVDYGSLHNLLETAESRDWDSVSDCSHLCGNLYMYWLDLYSSPDDSRYRAGMYETLQLGKSHG